MSSNNPNSGEMKYKGVRKRKWGKWVSEIRLPHSRERIWLGSYDSPEKAARAFDAAQFCLRGKNANFNFPENPPEIDGGQGLSPAEIQLAAARYANSGEEPVRTLPEMVVIEEDPPSSSSVQWESDDVCFDGGSGPFYNNYEMNHIMGSGYNYEAEFGLGLGFYGSHAQHQPDNMDYGYDNWNNGSGSQGSSFLWNF